VSSAAPQLRWPSRAVWLVAITALIVAIEWGKRVEEATPWVKLGAAPLAATSETDGWDWRFSWRTAIAIVFAVAAWWLLPRVASTMRLRLLVPITGLVAAVFALLLALSDGEAGVLEPVENPTEYWEYQPKLPPLREFLENYVYKVKWWPVHMRGHPPLFTMVLKFLRWIGLPGPWPVAVLSIIATALVPIFVLVTVHRLAGAPAVRKLAPFLALTPYAIWAMTSADIVYSANGAATVMTTVLAVQAQRIRSRIAWSLIAGLSFAALMFSTYGAVMFAMVILAAVGGLVVGRHGATPGLVESDDEPASAVVATPAMTTWHRVAAVAASAAVPVALVTYVFWHYGFWWIDGANETRDLYWKGSAKFRTWTYFSLVNATVPLIALGPAFVHGVSRLRSRLWWPVAGSIAAMVASTASQISKGEIERIWLIFYPWALIAAVGVPNRWARWWLGAQVVLAVVLQMGLLSKW
jgi:methylthioxylose transferase